MEVKMVQCPNGHYYNAAIHAACPECGAVSTSAATGGPGRTVGVNGADSDGTIFTTQPDKVSKAVDASGYVPGGAGPTISVSSPAISGTNAPDPFGATEIGGNGAGTVVSEPVVGWLVCIDGPVKGNDYRIHAGYNYIGRETGDIHISGDMQISRHSHAMIAYDSIDRAYYFGPSGGRNLVRVNGKTVLSAVEIHNYDVITVGTSKLMFVGLCGERFDWNKGVTNANG